MPRREGDLYPIRSEAELDALLASDRPTFIDFWAEWCGPCRRLGPIYARVAARYGDRAHFAKVDVEALPGLAARYQVRGIPMMLGFVSGKQGFKQVGLMGESDLMEEVETLLRRAEGAQSPAKPAETTSPAANEASPSVAQDAEVTAAAAEGRPSLGDRIRRMFGA